jgi:glucosamine--fructose-6-phosphate aminotransferase (isomerizing)
MCGIVAVVRRPSTGPDVDPAAVLGSMEEALSLLAGDPSPAELHQAGDLVVTADALLRGERGVAALIDLQDLVANLARACGSVIDRVAALERSLDATEAVNAGLLRLKDASWAISRDRLPMAAKVGVLAGDAAIAGYLSIEQVLASLDRLEVRGRDSAGVQVLVSNHGLVDVEEQVAERSGDPLYRTGSVRRAADGSLAFVYKAAAEIGELGDNTAHLRAAIANDQLLRAALADGAALVLGHTRWASVGIISEANAHPLDSSQPGSRGVPFVAAALNGDVDNYSELMTANGIAFPEGITTDAKVIPALIANRLTESEDLDEAFRSTVASFEGSVAIAALGSTERLHLALRGSGQALYVGLADDAYVVASEPYGLVEETSRYLRLDGETPGNPDNPTASRGQIMVLHADEAGTLDGLSRLSYDGTPLPLTESEVVEAEITTRDIDRGSHPHFLLKEIGEAPNSFRKTLRGRLGEGPDGLVVHLGPETLTDPVVERLQSVQQVIVIGQGTAAVAGRAIAEAIAAETAGSDVLVTSMPATELSGFDLRPDMADTLVVAISQSGTTTDTNRTVDLVRGRGAVVVAIVNRRNSDLTDRADGVLYTSDGRDVEMSVASTKAFYSQIAAGFLLAVALGDAVAGDAPDASRQQLLEALNGLPDAMEETLALRPQIAEIAGRLAPPRRYWALVGNGRNKVAAAEVRIKLSELCYKSIACDATEDKKHIDLSSEPLILVCATGLSGSTAADVAKEVAIYRAHKAAPILIADQGEESFAGQDDLILVPRVHASVAFVLSTVVGHMFGYEAALAIDAQARPLRETRAAVVDAFNTVRSAHEAALVARQRIEPFAGAFLAGLRSGAYNGHLEASTAVNLASAYRYALGITPLDSYQLDHGKVGTPTIVIDDLMAQLTSGIEELTRPIDAIKHQAKTVTVGISRGDESLVQVPLVAEVLAAGAARDTLTYRTLRTLAEIDPAVAEVTGFLHYSIDGDVDSDDARIFIVDRGGVAQGITSRVEHDPTLRGTKHRVATDQRIFVTQGRRDGRTIVLVPEVKDKQTVGLTLLHVGFVERLQPGVAASVLKGYYDRHSVLRDAVTETEPVFDEERLGEIDVVDLMVQPLADLADRFRE